MSQGISLTVIIKSSYDFISYQTDTNYKIKSQSNKSNPFSLIERVIINNKNKTDYRDCYLHFESKDNILSIEDVKIAYIEPELTTFVDDEIKEQFNKDRLYSLTQKITCGLDVSLIDKEGNILTKTEVSFDIWPISEVFRANDNLLLLPSFVTPSIDEISDVITKAYYELMKIKPGTNYYYGYNSNDENVVINEIQSVFEALRKLQIQLDHKFDLEGNLRKVNLPRDVLKNKKGTDLEVALLVCSCLEVIDLEPILILLENKILVGCFLTDNTFDYYIEKDITRIRDNLNGDDTNICVFDSSYITKGYEDLSFVQAQRDAKETITQYSSLKEFEAIDISKAHRSIYRPIPTRTVNTNGAVEFDPTSSAENNFEIVSPYVDKYLHKKKKKNVNKFDFWSKKLLDLSLANKLINFKTGASSPYFIIQNFQRFLNRLKDKETINIYPLNIENKEEEIAKLNLSELYTDEREYKYPVTGTVDDYRNLTKKAQSIVEETGANALYLTLGLVRYHPKGGEKEFKAPLILIPITAKQKASNHLYELTLNFDGITVNTTLFEYFKQNFDMEFDETYDINKDVFIESLDGISESLKRKSNDFCDIEVDKNKAYISILYFANFIIYNDIKTRKDQLLENNVIKCLVEGRTYNSETEKEADLSDLDKTIHVDDIAAPLPADSSQIRAIIDCAKGESFVLDGPPGTGKSQTIVNMIVNALYNKKTVLFVAEKMVALEVVKKRLDDIHLGNFCLELHSSKSNRKDFLAQIERSMNLERLSAPAEFDEESSQLESRKKELNDLITRTTEEKYFISLHDAIIKIEGLQDYAYEGAENYKDALTLSREDMDEIDSNVDDLVSISSVRGELSRNPYRMFDKDATKLLNNTEFYQSINNLKSYLNLLNISLNNLLNIFNFSFIKSKENLAKFIYILKIIQSNELVFRGIYNREFIDNIELNKNVLEQGVALNQVNDYLSEVFDKKVLRVNSKTYLSMLNEYKKRPFKRFRLKGKMVKDLRKFQLEDSLVKINRKNVENYMGSIESYKEKVKYINENKVFLEKTFMFKENLTQMDFASISKVFNNTVEFLQAVNDFNEFAREEDKLKNRSLFEQIYDAREQDYVHEILNKIIENYDNASSIEEALTKDFGYNKDYLFDADNNNYISSTLAMLDKELNNRTELNNLILVNKIIDKLDGLKFNKDLLKGLRLGEFKSSDLKNKFLYSVYKVILTEYFKDPYYGEFNGLLFNQAIKKYQDLLNEYSVLVVEKTANVLTEDFPVLSNSYATSSKIYGLRKLIKNGGRGTTIRKILIEYEDLIRQFCPCFLMSPLSAAQYLDINSKKFDIVIFDEASQIPTSEAIGAISRGNSLIVAGDPQQMPPTNFFKASISSGDSYSSTSDVEDLESLLDDCITLKMKRNPLLWHYRSSHESLIAFSNNVFYDHNLYTFPSPDNQETHVLFKYFKNGVYDNGLNRVEADAILQEVKRRFSDPKLCHDTIGIVTFNIKQQEYINKLIQNLFDQNPKFNQINNENEEPLFIKNLENVQGDERDVIIFSIGFGYNKYGKFLLNFGPLSLEKGERRLNVAVTRAKKEMIIYSSIRSIDIDDKRAKNNGATILKAFLDYAEKGPSTLLYENKNQIIYEEGIENFLQQDLKERGIESDIHVGDSKFKIDLCIKDKKGKYILGVICDSDSYIKSPTCRDRNYVQPSILTKLGWKIIRVYTLDYYKDKESVINDILQALNNLDSIEGTSNNVSLKDSVNFQKQEEVASELKKDYLAYPFQKTIPYDTLDEVPNVAVINVLEDVIKFEGPISEKLLLERFKRLVGVDKAGAKVRRIFNIQLKKLRGVRKVYDLNNTFYYPYGLNENNMNYFRTSSLYQRDIEDIPVPEIRNAMIYVLEIQGEILMDDLIRLVGNQFGVNVLTASSQDKLSALINYAINSYNDFQTNGNKVSLFKDK